MQNQADIYKQYLMLKQTEKRYSERLEILHKHYGVDIEVIAKILQDEEAKQ